MPRRGPDDRATEALIELLSRYSVTAAPAPTDVYRAFSRAPLLSSGMRLVSLVELRESDARYAMLTSIDGQGAAHSGRMQAVGANLLVERERLSEEWSPDWQAALRVMPARSGNELGPVREVKWQPSDATDTHAVAAAERLSSFDHVTGRVLGLLREGGSGQFEIVPQADWVRVAVFQYGKSMPDPTAFEALLTVARVLVDES